ncbi:MAG: N-acetylmuramoyl-L-alanine amidase [bacterium]|nr:N-acetylmuramoyl-L-alanine amidase [bacterium]
MAEATKGLGVIGGVGAAILAGFGLWMASVPFDSPAAPWDPDADTRPPAVGETASPAPTATAAPTTPRATPSPRPPTPPPPPSPLEGATIVLDPGHNSDNAANPRVINAQVPDGRGGFKACNTVGTMTNDGYAEHLFTWDVADRTRLLLEQGGATVVMTREATGIGPCVDERGATSTEADADLMISIHGNGSESPAPQGYFVMIVGNPLNDAQGEPSQALAAATAEALAAEGFTPSTWAGEIIERDDLATLNHATSPVIMVELAEFRNPEEAAAVQDPEVRQRYAQALADGAAAWLEDQD